MEREPEDDGYNWQRTLMIYATALWVGIVLSRLSRTLGCADWLSTRFILALAGTLFVAHFLRHGLRSKR